MQKQSYVTNNRAYERNKGNREDDSQSNSYRRKTEESTVDSFLNVYDPCTVKNGSSDQPRKMASGGNRQLNSFYSTHKIKLIEIIVHLKHLFKFNKTN